ncbi:MAG TPA: hypothetical protein PLS62_15330 [Desulfobacteraceae bacterium]|nr:hypothetical protein [Desulfobacteraceae bacterium]
MNYPAASYGVSTVIPAPNQVRDKLQPESTMISNGCPRIGVRGRLIKSGMTIDVFNRRSNTKAIQ